MTFCFKETFYFVAGRQVETLLQSRQLDPNSWLRFEGEDGDEEEATGLMIVCRVPATTAEKREVRRASDHLPSTRKASSDRRGSTTSIASDVSSVSGGSCGVLGKVSKDRVRMATLFVNHGADVNMRDAKGRTALMYASMNGLNEVVYYLLVIAGADYKIQEQDGSNSIMHALPHPAIVRLYLDAMDDVIGRPDSGFWRQRTRTGRSIFDLAKESISSSIIANNNSHTGCHKSLQLLTQFITNDNHFQAFKAPAPLPEQLVPRDQTAVITTTRPQHHSRRKSSTSSQTTTHSSGSGAKERLARIESVESEDQALSQMEQSMRRSRSLKEFWEKETIDWFGSSTAVDQQDSCYRSSGGSSRIPAVVIPMTNSKSPRASRSGPSMMFVPMNQVTDHKLASDPTIKLPPIASPLIRHEEWRERGHSLNRRTSVTLLRTVNPIH